MNETQVKYRDWEFFSDKETTELTYQEFQNSGAESCGCAQVSSAESFRDQMQYLSRFLSHSASCLSLA